MPPSPYLPVYELTRGAAVESVHFGAIAVVDPGGRLVASFGDPRSVTHLRSSAKPFQALPFVEQGGQAAYQLSPKELALICASHGGTDEHIAVLQSLQTKIGIGEADLQCGVHAPLHAPTTRDLQARGEQPTPNRHNCSGKHSGMLAYARLKGLPVPTTQDGMAYIDPEHPVQQDILRTLAEMCGLGQDEIALGIDGCSVPTFALPLYNAALGFARLCDPQAGQVGPPTRAEACRAITAAMTSYPELVAWPGGFDTRLMQVTGGRVLSKGGAEGYLAMGIFPGALGDASPALGIAIKISDGDLGSHSRPPGDPSGHARPAVGIEVLRQLGALTDAELGALEEYGPGFVVLNWRRLVVGTGRPVFQLIYGS